MAGGKQEIIINGKRFIDATDATTSGPIYSYYEAVELTKGNKIASNIGFTGEDYE